MNLTRFRTEKAPHGLESQHAVAVGRSRSWVDVGFGANLGHFKAGRVGSINRIPLADVLIPHRDETLVLGLGAGSVRGRGEWCDITTLHMNGQDTIHLQSYEAAADSTTTRLEHVATRSFSGSQGVEAIDLHPIAQFLFASAPASEPEGLVFSGRIDSDVSIKDLLVQDGVVIPTMKPGKLMVLIGGDLGELEYRPLKRSGPVEGRPFACVRSDPEQDVLWFKALGPELAARTALVPPTMLTRALSVVSIDTSSYTSIHAHAMVVGGAIGGHIEPSAIVRAGSSILVLAPHDAPIQIN